MDHGRDPCPWVILNDFGGAFCMGVSFSSLPLVASLSIWPLGRGNPDLLRTPLAQIF